MFGVFLSAFHSFLDRLVRSVLRPFYFKAFFCPIPADRRLRRIGGCLLFVGSAAWYGFNATMFALAAICGVILVFVAPVAYHRAVYAVSIGLEAGSAGNSFRQAISQDFDRGTWEAIAVSGKVRSLAVPGFFAGIFSIGGGFIFVLSVVALGWVELPLCALLWLALIYVEGV